MTAAFSYSQLYAFYRAAKAPTQPPTTSPPPVPQGGKKSVRFSTETKPMSLNVDGKSTSHELRRSARVQLVASQLQDGFVLSQQLPPLAAPIDEIDDPNVISSSLVSVAAARDSFEGGGFRRGPGTPHNSLKHPPATSPPAYPLSAPSFSAFTQPRQDIPSRRNWLLNDPGPPLPSSSINSSHITLINLQPPPPTSSLRFRPTPQGQSATLSHLRLTTGQLALNKSNSLGNSLEVVGKEDEVRLEKVPFARKNVFQLFSNAGQHPDVVKDASIHGDSCCHCDCSASSTVVAGERRSSSSDSLLLSDSPLPSSLHSPAFPSPRLPPTPSPTLRRHPPTSPTLSAHSGLSRRIKVKMGWRRKRVEDWRLDDILAWLEHLGLDNLATLLVGYDINGADVAAWDRGSLEDLGIRNWDTQDTILLEIDTLKNRQRSQSHDRHRHSSGKRGRSGLFRLVRDSYYDSIMALDMVLDPRDASFGEGPNGGLLLHRLHGSTNLLQHGDCVLEMDGVSMMSAGPLDLSAHLLGKRAGETTSLVVLRRRAVSASTPSLLTPPSSLSPPQPQSPSPPPLPPSAPPRDAVLHF